MTAKTEPPTPQVEKFRDLARELEADESEEAFDERLRKIATAPKPPEKPDAD